MTTDEELRKLAERLALAISVSYESSNEFGEVCFSDNFEDAYAASSAILSLMEERSKLIKLEQAAFTSYGREQNANHELQDRLNLAETRLERALEALRGTHAFLDSIAGHGYGGMAVYEIAREAARTVLSEMERENVDG